MGGRGPLALYVHVPFCTAKCPYCAFPSAPPERGDEERYLAGLEREARFWASRLGPRPLSSLYVGGGTPTRLSLPGWARLVRCLEGTFRFRDTTEITLEANPESLRGEHLAAWRDWRPLRVSLGVQSFRDEELAALGAEAELDDEAHQRVQEGVFNHGLLVFGGHGALLRECPTVAQSWMAANAAACIVAGCLFLKRLGSTRRQSRVY